MGGLVLWRTYSEATRVANDKVSRPTDNLFKQPKVLYVFACAAIASGLLCFVLQKDWFVGLNYLCKVPFYAMLGISFVFIVIFILSDCINYCSLTCSDTNTIPIIESAQQIYVLAGAAIAVGFLYGLIFGILDVEDANMYRLSLVALKDESYCYPIGIVVGLVAGFLNQMMRENGGQLSLGKHRRFDEEI